MRRTTSTLVGLCFFAVSLVASAQSSIPWIRDVQQAKQLAEQNQRLLLIHFYADWCEPCRTLDRTVFPHPDVGRSISANYVPLKIDIDRHQALAKEYDVRTVPTDVVVDASGRVLFQTTSPSSPAQYTQLLNSLASSQRLTNPIHTVAARMPQQGSQAGGYAQHGWAGARQEMPPEYASSGLPPRPDSGYDARSAWQADTSPPAASGFYGDTRRHNGWSQNETDSTHPFDPDTGDSAAGAGADVGSARSAAGSGGYNHNFRGNGGSQWPTAGGMETAIPGVESRSPQVPWGQAVGASNTPPGPAGMTPAPSWSRPQESTNQRPTSQAAPRSGNGFANPYVSDAAGSPAGSATAAAPAAGEASATDPPLAMDGFCAVTLAESEKWEKGSHLWGARHRGRTYLFVSQQQQMKFLADPDRYSPVLSGCDPTRYIDNGETVFGRRQHAMWFRRKVYFFADEASLIRFSERPEYYAQKAHEIMMSGGR